MIQLRLDVLRSELVRIRDDEWDPLGMRNAKRLEALLALWLHPPYWHLLDDSYHQTQGTGENASLVPTDEAIWEEFVRCAVPHAPCTTTYTLRRMLRVSGRAAREHPVRALAAKSGMSIVNGRVAFKRCSGVPTFGRS